MNCQKHKNHHCIHAHNCNNPNHHPKKQPIHNPKSKFRSKQKKLSKIVQENQEQCQFIYQNSHSSATVSQPQKNKQASTMKQQYDALHKKYENLLQKYRHSEAKLEYYQKQIVRIIKCTQTDLSKSTQKNLKQQSDFSTKLKLLENCLHTYQQQNRTLTDELTMQRQLNNQNIKLLELLKNQEEKMHKKYSKIRTIKEQSVKESQGCRKEILMYVERYGMLREEFQLVNRKNGGIIRKLREKVNELEIENVRMKKQLENMAEITKIDIQNKVQIIDRLTTQLKHSQANTQKLDNIHKQTQLKNIELASQLQKSKKILDKYIKSHHQKEQIFGQLDYSKNQSDDRWRQTNKQNLCQKQMISNLEYEKLVQENKELKVKLERAGGGDIVNNITNIQEYILNVGASEAFRKIIQEKNQTIKKLIRQKGNILRRCSCQQ